MNKKIFILLVAFLVFYTNTMSAQNFYSAKKLNNSNLSSSIVDKVNKKTLKTDHSATNLLTSNPIEGASKVVYLNETFDSAIPDTWTVLNTGAGPLPGWSWKNTHPATKLVGIAIIDSDNNGSNNTTAGILTSPAIDVAGKTDLVLEFDTRYHDANAGNSEKAIVQVWNGTTWITLLTWDENHGTVAVPEHVVIDISAYANAALKVRFDYTDGNSWYWEWSIDNVKVSTINAHDLAVTAIAPEVTLSGENLIPSVTIENIGINIETSYSVALSIPSLSYNEIIAVTNPILSSSSAVIVFPAITSPSNGAYTATASVIFAGDNNTVNNILTKDLSVLSVSYGYGFNAYSDTMPLPKGPAKINLITGEITSIDSNGCDFFAGADWANGVWYACQNVTNNLLTIDPITGAVTVVGPLGVPNCTGLAYDVTTQTMYLSGWDASEDKIYKVNLTTGAATIVGSAGNNLLIGIACGNDGVLYGIDLNANKLWRINKTSGAITEVGELGIDINYAQDIAFDRDNNILYGALYSTAGGLYRINTTNGKASLVKDIVLEIVGMAIPYVPKHKVAFSVVNGNGALSASVNAVAITSPAQVAQGDNVVFTATPAPNYEVKEWKLNGTVVAANVTNNYTLTSIYANVTIAVEFKLSNGIVNATENTFNIYPIPSSDVVNIKSNVKMSSITILNIYGQILAEIIVDSNEAILNTADLSNGMYQLRIETANGITMKKIQITR